MVLSRIVTETGKNWGKDPNRLKPNRDEIFNWYLSDENPGAQWEFIPVEN